MVTKTEKISIESLIKETNEIPTQPIYILKLLKLTSDIRTFSSDLVSHLAQDQGLASKIIGLARLKSKSTHIRASHIQQSIQRLGYQLVQNEVEVDLAKKYSHAVIPVKNHRLNTYWRLSIKTALVAKELAKLTNYEDYEMAFFAGLAHNLGRVILALRDIKTFEEIETLLKEGALSGREAEIEKLGFELNELGASFLLRGHMPEAVVEIIRKQNYAAYKDYLDPKLQKILVFAKFVAAALMDDGESTSKMWLRAQEHLKEIDLTLSYDEWTETINMLFLKILAFEDRVFVQR